MLAQGIAPIGSSASEKTDLVELLKSLTGALIDAALTQNTAR